MFYSHGVAMNYTSDFMLGGRVTDVNNFDLNDVVLKIKIDRYDTIADKSKTEEFEVSVSGNYFLNYEKVTLIEVAAFKVGYKPSVFKKSYIQVADEIVDVLKNDLRLGKITVDDFRNRKSSLFEHLVYTDKLFNFVLEECIIHMERSKAFSVNSNRNLPTRYSGACLLLSNTKHPKNTFSINPDLPEVDFSLQLLDDKVYLNAVNGGIFFVSEDLSLNDLNLAPSTGYTHKIELNDSIKKGRCFYFITSDGKYAKAEVGLYYKHPNNTEARFYIYKLFFQNDGTTYLDTN